MSLTCAISNEVPEVPVVSPVSGSIFEKRLIVKFIQENGTDPISGADLSVDQLIEIKMPPLVKPRGPSATSIPALLKSLQDEWDAAMLNQFTLRQQLQTTRQEVSHALYQHDAACRVIARLMKEVSSARSALGTLKPKGITPAGGDQHHPAGSSATTEGGVQEDATGETGLSSAVLEKLDSTAAVLTAERKKRGKHMPDDLVKPDELREYKTQSSHSALHSAAIPGIMALDICPRDTNRLATGGNDKNIVVFNREAEQVIATLKGHSKKVTHVIYHPAGESVISASPDSTIRVWSLSAAGGSGATSLLVKAHEGPISAISLHPTGDYLLSASVDEFWAFSDLSTGRVLTRAGDATQPHALTTTEFHPDGLIFGTGGSDSLVKVWDPKVGNPVATFTGHQGQISAMSFSENGYYLATSAEDSLIKLWDLRKLKNFKTIILDSDYQVRDLRFDYTGNYLAVAGSDVRIYLAKQWDCLRTWADHTAAATAVRFGQNANYVASVSLDRTLKIYSA